ncbi:CDP-glycerol glycerophosphotransferase family protein [Microbacterium esteraromaticum]|uniref:CDP-glycerol glycerophosphotransferase family protein n=1 Tax=Microbacterium esteraromaticum TaxID=57043 RepID=UPI00236799AB|nr:CDP-glycerol glycerophosphotransferase family protein [Microbacterium esteraromaticum]WDH78724.1 CDP-glycerol glycerophosphotransferase family protein [Microbacterium esteraromaticum]
MRQWLRRSLLLRRIRFLPYSLPYRLWATLKSVAPDRVLFLSDSHDGFVGNMQFLREAMLRESSSLEVIGIFKSSLSARRPLRDVLRLPYLLATSSVIVLDDFYPLIYRFPVRDEARLVQIWHAAGAFKQVGHSRAGLPGGPTPGSEIHRNYTDAVVSSSGIVDDYAEAFGIPAERVHPWGMPRSDAFFNVSTATQTRERVRRALGIGEGDRFVVFAPTFRGNGQRSATAAPVADWAGIADALGAGWRIGIRQHPFVAQGALPDGIIDASQIGDMNDLLMATDVLVTDYSSSIFEFALLRRPMVFFVPDLDEYEAARSFYRPFDHYAVGPVVREADGLAEAIRGAQVDVERFDAFVSEFADALDGRSSARIARELLGGNAGEMAL